MIKRPSIVVRADANSTIGFGHVMRCLALTQGCENVTFACRNIPSTLEDRIVTSGATMIHLESDDPTELKKIDADWIVIDGYHFDDTYLNAVKDKDRKVLFIDDYENSATQSIDLLLNQNVFATQLQYEGRDPSTNLLGPKYALLREEFSMELPKRTFKGAKKNILVTLGGADRENVTQKIIDAIKNIESIDVTIVIGGANPNLDSITAACSNASMTCIVDTAEMHNLMRNADIAITAGGTTCLELACMGVPMITTILADNQKAVAEGFAKEGASHNLGWYEEVSQDAIAQAVSTLAHDPQALSTMSAKGSALVDGFGAARVRMKMFDDRLWLRNATANDCDMIFEWANDPETRSASFSSDEISLKEHEQWFNKILKDPNAKFYIAVDQNDNPIGQVRFAIEDSAATISVSIAPKHRGKGYGSEIVLQGCTQLLSTEAVEKIDAYIKPENEASSAVFEKVGFTKTDNTELKGLSALHYVYHR